MDSSVNESSLSFPFPATARGCPLPDPRFASPHDWRLWERKPCHLAHEQKDAPGYGWLEQVGWTEIWYCTRCRHIESREVGL